MDPIVAGLPERVRGCLEAITRLASEVLGDNLVGAYLSGSAAMGDFAPATSDLDVTLIVGDHLAEGARQRLVDGLLEVLAERAERGIELVVYPLTALEAWPPRWDLNFNAGPGHPLRIESDPGDEQGFWFTLDLALLQSNGIALSGPSHPPVPPVPAEAVSRALRESLAWHRSGDATLANVVFATCRALRWAADGRLGSKAEAAAWAEHELAGSSLAGLAREAAEARQSGAPPDLDPALVDGLLNQADAAVAAQREGAR